MAVTPISPADVVHALTMHGYIADEGLATSVYLAMTLRRPLLLEGEPGVGADRAKPRAVRREAADVVGLTVRDVHCAVRANAESVRAQDMRCDAPGLHDAPILAEAYDAARGHVERDDRSAGRRGEGDRLVCR